MLKVGLTGGIGSGKSSAARIFLGLGCPTLDLDAVARDVTAPGTRALVAITEAFGSGMLRSDGSLDRQRLAALVFQDADARLRLEGIVHPAVMQAAEEWVRERVAHSVPVAMLEIPLLFEVGLEHAVDRIVLVTAEIPIRIQRLTSSRRMRPEDGMARIEAQISDDVKRARSDYVIENNGTLEALKEKVESTWRCLLADSGGH